MLPSMTRSLINNRNLQNKLGKIVNGSLFFYGNIRFSALHVQERQYLPIEGSVFPNAMDMQALAEERTHVLMYSDLLKDLVQVGNCDILNEAKKRLIEALKYSVPYGRQFEGLGIVHTYKLIESPNNLTEKNLKLAHVLSWCIAMQSAGHQIDDDIMDNEETRKGIPCWHTLKNVGLTAINDSFLIENAVFVILKKYFSDHQGYVPIMELFHKTNYEIALGQLIDVTSTVNERPRFEVFTRERMEFLGKYKSTAFCYEYTLKLAMYLAGIYDPELHERVSSITSKIGLLFMVHNDVQDAFCEVEVAGKKSTDIRNGKCSWLAVEALERGSPIQRRILMEHYGKPFNESEQKIKDLYKELKLADVYAKFEKETVSSVYSEMEHVLDRIPKKVFDNFLSDVTLYAYR